MEMRVEEVRVRPGPPPEAAEPRRRVREQPHARREQSGVGALRALLAARRRDRRPRLSQNTSNQFWRHSKEW